VKHERLPGGVGGAAPRVGGAHPRVGGAHPQVGGALLVRYHLILLILAITEELSSAALRQSSPELYA
jgi:hypothetical protein